MKVYVLDDVQKIETGIIEKALQVMPRARMLQAEKLLLSRDRVVNAASFLLLAYGLKAQGISINEIELTYGKNKKPYLTNNKWYFNISHSKEAIACGVSKFECGVDIEKIRPVSDSLLTRVCSEEEKNAILASSNREKAFAQLWAKKEAYIKFKGGSVLTDLKKIDEKIKEEKVFVHLLHQEGYGLCACSGKEEFAEKIAVTKEQISRFE